MTKPESQSSLNPRHTRYQERVERINGLAVRQEVKQLLTGLLEVGPFQEYFAEPSYFYAQGYPHSPGSWPTFGDRKLLPLWQHCEKLYALDVGTDHPELLSWYIESPEEFTVIPSVDTALFDMIVLHVWEFGGEEQEALEAMHFARQIRLPNLERLRDVLQCAPDEYPSEMIDEYRHSL